MNFIPKILFLSAFLCWSSFLFGQDYLDKDKRFMKLTSVSVDKKYGYTLKKPIQVGSDEKAIGAYLNSLKVADEDRLHIGDMKFNYKNKTGLIMVVLTYEKKEESTPLYFLTTKFSQPPAPLNLGFKTIEDLPKVVLFPSEKIKKTVPCNEKLWAVDNFLLEEKLGLSLDAPTTNASYKKGEEALKAYFAEHPLTDPKLKGSVFRVAIAFVVNCKGEAGNFMVVTQGRGPLVTYGNQILGIVNDMPQEWKPAVNDGVEVDSYQVLSFMVTSGTLDKVSYK